MVHQKANPQLKLFSLSSNPEIAEKIAEATGLPLGKVSSRQFSDGEIMMSNSQRWSLTGLLVDWMI